MEKTLLIRAQKNIGRQSRQKGHVQRQCDLKKKNVFMDLHVFEEGWSLQCKRVDDESREW